MSTPTDPEASWRRPDESEHRSPCPALNALANHGDLPRSGVVTVEQLVEALDRRLGLAPAVGKRLATAAMDGIGKPGPDGVKVLDLADLGKHGFIEHDASLTRRDARNGDAVELVTPLLDQLLSLSEDGRTLTLADFAVAHQLRLAQSRGDGHGIPVKASALGAFEAAVLYCVLNRDGRVDVEDARQFLEQEKLPAGVPLRKIGWGTLLGAVAKLVTVGNLPVFAPARRASRLAREVPEPEAARCPVTGAKQPLPTD